MMKHCSFTISKEEASVRVDAFLSHKQDLTRSLIKSYKENLKVNNAVVKPSYILKAGDTLYFSYDEVVEQSPLLEKENIPLNIIYEDEDIIVLNKEAGMVVHPAKGNWSGTLANAIAYHLDEQDPYNLRPGIVHRLDKDTSGLMVVAKHFEAQKNMMALFKNRKILKVYLALVKGHLPKSHDTIDLPLARHPYKKFLYAVNKIKGKQALSEYRIVEEFPKTTLIKVRIHTGRTHQIRVHFSSMGNAVVGDKLYSSFYHEHPLCLVAQKLSFAHPITQELLSFEIDPPDNIQQTINHFNKKIIKK